MRFTILTAVLAVGCTTEETSVLDQVDFQGDIPADVDTVSVTQDFLASGAQFGVVVDPASGDVATLQNLDRVDNSADFTQLGEATCADCGGINATCTGPAGNQRQIDVSLQRNTGSGPVDVAYVGNTNFAPVGQNCNGSACPATNVDASGGPVPFDVTLIGNLTTCSSFAVFFNTDGPAPTTDVTFYTTTDNAMQMWVDGVAQSLPNGNNWQVRDVVTVPLTSGPHSVAVAAQDAGGPQMFTLVAKDDTNTTILTSDSSWRTIANPPAGFEAPAFDDSGWGFAIDSADGCGAAPLGPWTNPLALSPAEGNFIWTAPGCNSGPANVGFRTTINVP